VLQLAGDGLDALRKNPMLRHGLNTYCGHVTHAAVAEAFHMDFVEAEAALG
jgi:alanine dehydrogenase